MKNEYLVTTTAPNGFMEYYQIFAKNKTEARAKAAKVYREETPKGIGCYTWTQHKVKIELVETIC